MDTVAKLKNASKKYKTGDTEIIALDKCDLSFNSHELTLILGPSGSGKTTLISLIGCVIYPTEGEVIVKDQNVTNLSEKELAHIRLKNIGFVFQGANLIQPLTALENVMAPLLLKKEDPKSARQKAEKALEQVNLLDRKNNLPNALSGGQRQRVAIARALVTDPPILLCDEPTASIDAASAAKVMQDLKNLADSGKAVLVVTHDTRLRQFSDRIVYVSEGKTSNEPFEDDAYDLDKEAAQSVNDPSSHNKSSSMGKPDSDSDDKQYTNSNKTQRP